MKHPTSRRTALLAAGLLATGAAALTESTAAQSTDVSGTVKFQGDAVVPKGQIVIYAEDSAVPKARALAVKTQLKSDGRTKAMAFSLPLPASATASSTLQIVARLERGDGWLLARGSAKLKAGTSVEIILYTVMY
jgi:hypothetical protein